MIYSYELTDLVIKDIDDTLNYISNKLFNKKAAIDLMNNIEACINNICAFPLSYPNCNYYLIKDDYYDEKVKPLLESFLYNASCALNYWALELYKDRELIMVIHFEDDYVEISEKYYNECYDIIKLLLIKEPLCNEINISKINSNSDKILVMLNNFELLRSLDEKQCIKIPNSNVDFSYEIYNSIVGIIYPKDIKECFQNLKDGDWQKSNYDNVLFCNCLIYINMGIT